MENIGKFPYRPAKLNDRNGDISKRWYVAFYVWDIAKEKLVRRQDFSINKFKTLKTRREAAKELIRELNDALKEGLVVDSTPLPKQNPNNSEMLTSKTSFSKAFERILDIKKATTKPRTAHTYESYAAILREWMRESGLERRPIDSIKETEVYQLADFLTLRVKRERKISNRTINNYFEFLVSIFNQLVKRKLIPDNPFHAWDKLPTDVGRNLAYNHAQKVQLLKTFENPKYIALRRFVMCIYYLLGRPNAIRLAKVKDIGDGEWFFPREHSKNGKDHYAIIPAQLQEELKKMELEAYPADFYLIGRNGKPSKIPVSVSYFSNMHRTIIKKLGYSDDYTLYSWKHTGVVDAFKSGIDIRRLQLQIGHSELGTTATYLKSLGLLTDRGLINRFPDLPFPSEP